MFYPQIAATENAVYIDPVTNITTFITINAGTQAKPDYQWKRNPELSVARSFTPVDEARIINAEYQAALAAGRVKRGTLLQMMDDYNALYYVLEDPDTAIDAQYGGAWNQRRNNWFKLEQFGIEIVNDTVTPVTPDPDPDPVTTPTNPVVGPVDVGDHGVRIDGNSIIFPDSDYYQVQDYNIPQNTLYEGVPTQNLVLPDGVYIVINLTDNLRTPNVVLPAEATTPVIVEGNYIEMGSFGFSVDGLKVRFSENDYYQIQETTNFTTIWEGNGPYDSTLSEGTYKIIKLTAPVQTIEGLMLPYTGNSGSVVNAPDNGTVTVGTLGLEVTGNDIRFTTTNYYQIKDLSTGVDIFQGNGPVTRTLSNGTYQFDNLDTGERVRDFVIPIA